MLWACIHLPRLALDAVLRQVPDPTLPVALVEGHAQSRLIHSVNAVAEAGGIAAGMRLATAQAILPDLKCVPYDAASESKWQQFLAAWAYRHSSQVSTLWPNAIVLEVKASFQLFGPWPVIESRLRSELSELGFEHRIAMAPVARAAHVFAQLQDGFAVPDEDVMLRALNQVPVECAGLPDKTAERLKQTGIRKLGQVMALPADGLRRRVGSEVPELLAKMRGQAFESLPLYAPPDHFDARVELEYEVSAQQALLFPMRRLIQDLAVHLSIRDGGVQHFLLRLEHEGQGRHTDMQVGLITAEREASMLFDIAKSRLERVRIPAPVVGLRLIARELPAFTPSVRDLFDLKNSCTMPWPQLRERLRARLGDTAVHRLAAADDPRPERAWMRVQGVQDAACMKKAPPRPPRPLWLLQRPIPLRESNPRILSGPERLESGWWDGEDARRDYYVLETRTGQRAWAFTAPGEQAHWMLHGWFA